MEYVKKVQQLAATMVVGLKVSYTSDAPPNLRFQTLKHRRLRGDPKLAFAILIGKFDLLLQVLFTRTPSEILRGLYFELYQQHFCVNRRGSAFSSPSVYKTLSSNCRTPGVHKGY